MTFPCSSSTVKVPVLKLVQSWPKQIEYYTGGIKLISSIVWTSDCEYELTHLKAVNYELPKGNVTKVKITRIFEVGYEGLGSSNLVPKPQKVVMHLVEWSDLISASMACWLMIRMKCLCPMNVAVDILLLNFRAEGLSLERAHVIVWNANYKKSWT